MGVINTLQQLTFNILPQPLTPLMADWLCKGWKPCSWEWHEYYWCRSTKAGCSAAEPVTPANTASIWSHSNHKRTDQELFLQVSLLLTLPFSSPWLALLGFVCVSSQYPPSLQIPFPSSPAVLHNLISCDVFLSIRELLSISIKFKPFQRTHNAIISYKIQAQFRPYRL